MYYSERHSQLLLLLNIERFNADSVFFFCRGVSHEGVLSDSMEDETLIRQVMLPRAKQKIFLCDRSKIGLEYHYRLCRTQDVDAIVSDDVP